MSKEVALLNGEKRTYKPPPKYVLWRHNRTGAAFTGRIEQIASGTPGQSFEESGQAFFESMSDEEGAAFEAMADDVVCHSFGQPYLTDANLVKPEDYMRQEKMR